LLALGLELAIICGKYSDGLNLTRIKRYRCMLKRRFSILILLVLLPTVCFAIEPQQADVFGGQDLHLAANKLTSYQTNSGRHILVFEGDFSASIGANEFKADDGVVWLEVVTTESRGQIRKNIKTRIYLAQIVPAQESVIDKTIFISQSPVESGRSMVIEFDVSGEVFVTADKREIADPRSSQLYQRAVAASESVDFGPEFVIQREAKVPRPVPERPPKKEKAIIPEPAAARKEPVKKAPVKVEAEPKEPQFRYPVNIAPAGELRPKIEWEDKTNIGTIIGRFYLWQKQDESDRLLELQADNAVMFRSRKKPFAQPASDVLAKGDLRAIYMSGDVLMTNGPRTTRADEVYYDFHYKKALAINAEMRNYDTGRGVPIYVRAAELRQIAENKFAAEDITLTTSEFYKPQISTTARYGVITDTTPIDQQTGKVGDSSYDAELYDVRMKVGDATIFYWPKLRSNMSRPDIPIKRIHLGHDSIWGTSVESQWYLSRLLGLKEPEGVDSTLLLDYYSKRGVGTGARIEYGSEDYHGTISGYIIHDNDEDRLGRDSSRRNLEPDKNLRGRFGWLHRQYLPYNWQLSAGLNYESDENFIESYYRSEFNYNPGRETYIHLKRSEANWGLSFLGKGRINDFVDQTESLPSVEFHLTGQSFSDDKLTLYSDTEVGRLRQRIGDNHNIAVDEDMFAFASHRTEFDMPLRSGVFKIVPFVAGTFGYDDRSGFRRSLVNGENTGDFGEEMVWIGEAGVRIGTQYAKVYPNVKSRLWNLNKLRHIIKPRIFAVHYEETDNLVDQRDILSVGLSQRLQTKRMIGDEERNIDWMRLDVDFAWVDGSGDASAGPEEYIWSNPMIPIGVFSLPEIFNGDFSSGLNRVELFGPRRNYFSADYMWRISDTAAMMGDMNFDLQSSVVQQCSIGLSRLAWPNLSYYIGSRYLRRTDILGEKGTNAFTFAATYVLDPRYTLVFAQQFDFDYGANMRSDITLIRKYHRLNYGLTYSADGSLDRQAIVFSIWPEGISELGTGSRRYMGLGGTAGY